MRDPPRSEPPISPPPSAAIRAADPLAPAMARLAAGVREALRDVYDATRAKLFGVVLRILRDRSESEDVLQEVYLAVWRRAGAFDPERASAAAWLTAVARNRAIDRLRARPARPQAPPEVAYDLPDPAPSPEAALETSDEGRRLQACLDTLRPDEARTIRTAFLEGVTYEALALRTGKPLGTVKSWVRRGLLRLRECLEP